MNVDCVINQTIIFWPKINNRLSSGCSSLLPAFGRLRQEDPKFKDSLDYTLSPCLKKKKINNNMKSINVQIRVFIGWKQSKTNLAKETKGELLSIAHGISRRLIRVRKVQKPEPQQRLRNRT
jgi:hypothetical protein